MSNKEFTPKELKSALNAIMINVGFLEYEFPDGKIVQFNTVLMSKDGKMNLLSIKNGEELYMTGPFYLDREKNDLVINCEEGSFKFKILNNKFGGTK